jgi:ABC-2 type transport system permease protein
MNTRIILALLKKDLRLFLSNRFYLLITVVGMVFFIAAYFILPSQTDDTLKLGMYAPELPPAFSPANLEEGIEIELYNDPETLRQAVLDGRVLMAIVLPADIIQTWSQGGLPPIVVYSSASAPPEMRAAVVTMVEEMSFTQSGQALNYSTTVEVLGTDLQNGRIALRDRMRPLLAAIILLVEIMTLASLISSEIEQGTARALLISPLRVSDLFLAKGILGVALALVQAIVFMLLTGGFHQQPSIVLITLLLGSGLVVGAAFLLASITRDVNAVTGWGLVVLMVLAIPGFGAAIPGLLSNWARLIPSYYLTDTLNRVINYGLGWTDIGLNLIILAILVGLLLWGGMAVLRRRYQ